MLPLSSGFPPSAPRTGQVAFTTSGAPTPATFVFSHCTFAFRSRQPIAVRWAFQCPECLDPFALCWPFSSALGGRNATDYYGSAAPVPALVIAPPTPPWGAVTGSGVARTVRFPSTVGTLLPSL